MSLKDRKTSIIIRLLKNECMSKNIFKFNFWVENN